jgi:hypothetical protein
LSCHGFGTLMIRRHAESHQAIGRGQAVEDVDFQVWPLAEQGIGAKQSGRTAADYGDMVQHGFVSAMIGQIVAATLVQPALVMQTCRPDFRPLSAACHD